MDRMELKRGEVYIADLPVKENSRIQGGKRPVVILSNDKNNQFCDFVHYVPLTSQMKRLDLPVHIEITSDFLYKPSMALCEQEAREDKKDLLQYIDKRIGCIGKLSEYDMKNISYGVAIQLGFVLMLEPQKQRCYA